MKDKKCPICNKSTNCLGRCGNTVCELYSHKVVEAPSEIECEECGGSGELMEMVCYGGSPLERRDICHHCEGEGVVSDFIGFDPYDI